MPLTKEEERILRKIREQERSPNLPQFPATKMKKILVEGVGEVLVKDESESPTGTHKGRMSWEILMIYKEILEAKEKGLHNKNLPSLSIISAGSAAMAIQKRLKEFELPNVRVLIDEETSKEIEENLKRAGCKIYKTNLSKKALSPHEILELTNNEEGFDVTSNKGFDPNIRFYDWLSIEVLNENPDYVFIPFGTGQLYENILNTARKAAMKERIDSAFKGSLEKIRKCKFLGATTDNPKTKAVKLYAPFRPFTTEGEEWVRLYALRGICSEESGIKQVEEEKIIEGTRILNENGIPAEYSAGAGMGLLLQMREKIPKNSKIIVVSTGKTENFL